MISNHADHAEVAEWFGVDFVHLPVTADTKPAQEAALQAALAEHGVTLVVLARYMQILQRELRAPSGPTPSSTSTIRSCPRSWVVARTTRPTNGG